MAYADVEKGSFIDIPTAAKPDEETLTKVDNILKVKDGGITTAKIADSAITDIKIASGTIEQNKLRFPLAIKAPVTSFSTSSTSFIDVDNSEVCLWVLSHRDEYVGPLSYGASKLRVIVAYSGYDISYNDIKVIARKSDGNDEDITFPTVTRKTLAQFKFLSGPYDTTLSLPSNIDSLRFAVKTNGTNVTIYAIWYMLY